MQTHCIEFQRRESECRTVTGAALMLPCGKMGFPTMNISDGDYIRSAVLEVIEPSEGCDAVRIGTDYDDVCVGKCDIVRSGVFELNPQSVRVTVGGMVKLTSACPTDRVNGVFKLTLVLSKVPKQMPTSRPNCLRMTA